MVFLWSLGLYGAQEFDFVEAGPKAPVEAPSLDYIKNYLESRVAENGEGLARKALDLMKGKGAEEIQRIWFYYKEESFANRYIDLIENYNRFVPSKKNKEELRPAPLQLNEQYNEKIKQLYEELRVPLSATTLIPEGNAQKLSISPKKPAIIEKLSELVRQIEENKQAVERFNGRTARKNKLKMRYNKSIAAYYKELGLDVPLVARLYRQYEKNVQDLKEIYKDKRRYRFHLHSFTREFIEQRKHFVRRVEQYRDDFVKKVTEIFQEPLSAESLQTADELFPLEEHVKLALGALNEVHQRALKQVSADSIKREISDVESDYKKQRQELRAMLPYALQALIESPAEHAPENRHVVAQVISVIRKYPLVFSVGTLAVIVAFYKLKHFNKKNLLI
jgi:hypothetical protein